MNKIILTKIERIEEILKKNISYMALALIEKRESTKSRESFEELDSIEDFLWLKSQYQYMNIADILFWFDDDEFKDHQNDIIMYEVKNPAQYICIGEVAPYPILLNKKNGYVYCVTSELGEECEIKEYNKFENFINEYVVGEKYLEIGSSQKWYKFMKENEIIEE
ncbi:hypothetical protein [Clostridium estertheticum]|uniref:SMI1/KNR4 family protein n=1 Tax=Clostridium estertheticum subsp. estertheticum TaxID=1552 RepID=A0A1J0GG21_9CLOT|nr:hypothetical protein [Clostridium estertheticum]APC40313.1 hypothetical protein A7L45_09665 [Clostridium estertheticum subsp. estertheticum]MBZ9617877.1 hypothetical protein [Clostridium estertheticum subsp. laramiense]WAG73540.1 hypothetical protein LL032_20850 [Clostridium estertheticum]